MSKRIRFGLIFVGLPAAKDGEFLSGLGIKHIEGCDIGEKHYVLFSLDKAKKATDVLNAVAEHNQRCPASDLEEELLMASDGMPTSCSPAMLLLPCNGEVASGGKKRHMAALSKVAVFDKGPAFQTHEIFRAIQTAKLCLNQVQAPPIPGDSFLVLSNSANNHTPSGFWTWGSTDEATLSFSSPPAAAPVPKRAINELSSDLVEDCIKPSAPKRVSFSPSLDTVSADDSPPPAGDSGEDDAVLVEQQVCFVCI